MPSFTIKVETSDTFITDIMTTMVEQSYHWFTFRNVVRNWNLEVQSFEAHEVDPDDDTMSDEDITYDGEWETVTPLSIVDTIEKFIEDESIVNETLMEHLIRGVAESDAGEIDADLADCLLQYTVFDEVRYG